MRRRYLIYCLIVGVLVLIHYWPKIDLAIDRYIRNRQVEAIDRSVMTVTSSALMAYADHNGGHFPGRLSELYSEGYVDDPFYLTLSWDFPVPGTPRAEVATWLNQDDHIGYLYYGYGLSRSSPPGSVLMAEPLGGVDYFNGGHVLFTSGKIVFLRPSEFKAVLARLKQAPNGAPSINPSTTRAAQ
jgi:hypothetical protein